MDKLEKRLLSKAILQLHNSMENFISGLLFAHSGDEKKAIEYSEESDRLFNEAKLVLLTFVDNCQDDNLD